MAEKKILIDLLIELTPPKKSGGEYTIYLSDADLYHLNNNKLQRLKIALGEKPRGAGGGGDKPRGAGGGGDKPRGAGRGGDKPRGAGKRGDKPRKRR